MKGTGACVYSLMLFGNIGMIICYHLNGKIRHNNDSLTKPNTVLDCDMSRIFFYKRIDSNRLMILSTCRNLNKQYIDLS
jgi:hypothetical protein